MKNLTWQNPEQLFVAQELINKVKSKCCGIKVYNLAKSKRLNMTEFDAYLHSSDKYKEMDKVINQLVERGLMATPTIIINDRLVYVTNSYEELSRLLEYEL